MNEFTKVFAKSIEDEAIKQIEVLSNSDAYSGCEIRQWMVLQKRLRNIL